MQRKTLNLLMTGLVAVLIVVVIFSQEEEAPPVLLTSLDIDSIDHIEVIHPDSKPIVLDKYSYGWALSAPVQVSADELQVNALLELATRESSAQYPVAEMDLAAVGLETPEFSIRLNDVMLDFGDKEPIEDRRYVRVGETVFLTPNPPSTALDANYSDLVHALVIPDSEKQIEAIKFKDYQIVRNESGGWKVVPESASKGADAAQTLMDHWNGARSLWKALLTDEDKPTASATLTLGEKKVEFQIVATDPQLKLARPDIGIVYTLPPRYASDLFELKAPPEPEDAEDARNENDNPAANLLPDAVTE